MSVWVYERTEANLWTVGFYGPTGKWNTDNDYNDRNKARERVAYLNGGGQSHLLELNRLQALMAKILIEAKDLKNGLEQPNSAIVDTIFITPTGTAVDFIDEIIRLSSEGLGVDKR